jgi:hypothetical protein
VSDAEALEDGDETPLYPSEFYGWRGWVVEKGVLRSVNDRDIWVPGEPFEAECSAGKSHKRVPWERCSCGLYSTKTLVKLQKNGYHHLGAWGRVAIWGEIIEASDGWRSQFAYPVMIYVSNLAWRRVKPLERYGVPVLLENPYTMRETEAA